MTGNLIGANVAKNEEESGNGFYQTFATACL
jgi:hypothetical protein